MNTIMNFRTILTALTGAIGISLITTFPVNAISFFNGGGTIKNSDDTTFDFNVTSTSTPSTVSLNIASLTSSSQSNLFIYLRSTSDTLLLTNNLADGISFSNVKFSDAGSETTGVTASYSNGNFLSLPAIDDTEGIASINNFSSFTIADGTWSLFIRSFNGSDDSIGTITLNIEPAIPVPFEFNLATGLLGLVAAWTFKQSLKKK
jgi:hypothetical protein